MKAFFRYQTVLRILSPVVAVMLAFVVGGIIILVFIKSFVFTPAALVQLQHLGGFVQLSLSYGEWI